MSNVPKKNKQWFSIFPLTRNWKNPSPRWRVNHMIYLMIFWYKFGKKVFCAFVCKRSKKQVNRLIMCFIAPPWRGRLEMAVFSQSIQCNNHNDWTGLRNTVRKRQITCDLARSDVLVLLIGKFSIWYDTLSSTCHIKIFPGNWGTSQNFYVSSKCFQTFINVFMDNYKLTNYFSMTSSKQREPRLTQPEAPTYIAQKYVVLCVVSPV